ncbi:MAG: hypothetical protein JO112_02870, partial [Planctomycetes bacterium]|nr:hypothetical protein [Planctomycetota bacterium]
DPGGVGYFRMQSQYQLADTGTTSISLALHAVTPAGLESNGVASGPTFVSPALAWYHQLDPSGLALHGFLGNNLRAPSRLGDGLDQTLKYGFALQSPLAGDRNSAGQSLQMFVEALGRYSLDSDPSAEPRPGSSWELVPGLHWRMGENGWLSGGVIVPLGPVHVPANLWQITWSWRF